MDKTFATVASLRAQGMSICNIAQHPAVNVSPQKVRKILITQGLYTTPIISQAIVLRNSGACVDDIARLLSIKAKTVHSLLPYTKGAYKAASPTPNALRIRDHRERKQRQNKARSDGHGA